MKVLRKRQQAAALDRVVLLNQIGKTLLDMLSNNDTMHPRVLIDTLSKMEDITAELSFFIGGIDGMKSVRDRLLKKGNAG